MKISLQGLNKAAVLAALYNASHPQGLGWMHWKPYNMSVQHAEQVFNESADKYFDYVGGRVVKVDLSGDWFDTWGYDRDNGEGAAKSALEAAGIPVTLAEG